MTIDMSGLLDLSELSDETDTNADDPLELKEMCDGAEHPADVPENMEVRSRKCTVLNKSTVQIISVFKLNDSAQLRSRTLANGDIEYTYQSKPEDSLSEDYFSSSSDDADLSQIMESDESTEEDEFVSALTSAIIDVSHTVTMPGRITKYTAGTLQSANVIFLDTDDYIDAGGTVVITSVAPAGSSEAQGIYSSNFIDRVCTRVQKFADRPSVYERVLQRVQSRFGFQC